MVETQHLPNKQGQVNPGGTWLRIPNPQCNRGGIGILNLYWIRYPGKCTFITIEVQVIVWIKI